MPTLVHHTDIAPLDAALIARWAAVPTTITADLTKGRALVSPLIRPLRPFGDAGRLVGRAVTALCEPPDFGCVLHAVTLAKPGDIVVIAAGGDPDTAMIGELLSGSARLHGIKGVVCDGAVRDVGTLMQWADFPVFSRSVTARGPASKHGGAVNVPVTFGGVQIRPGDLLIGDDDGLVVLSPADAADLIGGAEGKCADEARWEAQLRAGASLLDVFAVPAAEKAEG